MATEKPTVITLPSPITTGRRVSPSPHGLRQRPLSRAATFAEGNNPAKGRTGSFLSETFSETRRSLRSSTDDILLPRPAGNHDSQDHDENSHWQSLPLGLALLPAVGGLFFKNGSAVITDITLLGLAAIFMNWALRSPWDWYHAAQAPILLEPSSPTVFTPIDEVDEPPMAKTDSDLDGEGAPGRKPGFKTVASPAKAENASSQRELRIYELMALVSCFLCPLLAAWLLHGIRSQLSRPSEGLVSNYNLTIFMLVAEIRPVSHLIKLVQRRTLFLQRRVNADALKETSRADSQQLRDVTRRLEEMEAHIADRIADSSAQENQQGNDALAAKASTMATSEVKRTVQPELDALNRAMRRYEKRTTISSVQIEARLQDLEMRLHDVVSLAAAAQRNADRKPDNYTVILTNWVSGMVVIPVQYLLYITSVPSRMLDSVLSFPKRYFNREAKPQTAREGKVPRRSASSRSNSERERRPKTVS